MGRLRSFVWVVRPVSRWPDHPDEACQAAHLTPVGPSAAHFRHRVPDRTSMRVVINASGHPTIVGWPLWLSERGRGEPDSEHAHPPQSRRTTDCGQTSITLQRHLYEHPFLTQRFVEV